MKIDIKEHDFDLILMGYLRYSMGRMTYMVPHCMEQLAKYVPLMSISRQNWYVNEIFRELNRYQRKGETMGTYNDQVMWEDLVVFLQEQIDKQENK